VSFDIQAFVEAGRGRLPGLLGVEIDVIEAGHVRMHLSLRPALLAPNGYLHAGTVVALADSACDRLHDDRVEDQLPRDFPRRHRTRRVKARPRRPHDAGLGRDDFRRRR